LECTSVELKVQAATARVAAGNVSYLEDGAGNAGLFAGIEPQQARDLTGTLSCLDDVTPAADRQREKKGTHGFVSSLTVSKSKERRTDCNSLATTQASRVILFRPLAA
jgi:hypothetical protein